ncbi:D-glycero-alpha-D-manno-heptose 1-phosphate guanylyltransferase [Marinobacterium sp. xm-a-121]|nr:D-glycero-alpha-D-manno-heptose 1-phosphate guanylyltransferase [Marinobacterium sp. xm-g-48]NRP27756.1 D-glycero-alpha-D-manno-heptose 1-phosphate guanylyltransferase [Marinobacterium sp. xm-d-420]NRP38335.1 D-glycero-alpha-D-manno-heptose 1-phosphate guanylyltransferase [Marinobacterium sp. xm-a-121]NRP59973.1 D-glycero-alpha-D-manno-heptose 1-phosphate guanylyltransferase [Marinobacterium sp. xm-d-564]NRP83278.1 D-glycero-alpha-D-manno-heptose 1-phosphate guanylyltransferase [Marinobacter
MRPLTLTTPKPLIPALGKPLIVYQIENLVRAGITDIVINHAWLGDQIERTLGSGEQFRCSLRYSAEQEPLETAGGIRKALPMLKSEDSDQPFILVNGDVYLSQEYSDLDLTLDSDDLAKLWLVDNPSWHSDGDFALSDQRVSLQGDEKLTFAGVSLLRPSQFDELALNEKAALAPLLRRMIEQSKVAGAKLGGYWNDVGTVDRLADVETFLKEAG